jgi:hypothetical protein
MDSAVKRPWYRLHWVTWVVTCGLLLALINRQMDVNSGGWENTKWTHFGWPVIHLDVIEYMPASHLGAPPVSLVGVQRIIKYHWRWFALTINVVTFLLFLGSTAFAVETFFRNYRRLQFSVGNLIVITGVLGVILAMLIYKPAFLLGGRWYGLELSYLVAWRDFQQPVHWPVLLGLACTIYSLGWLALALLRRAYRLFHRHALDPAERGQHPS